MASIRICTKCKFITEEKKCLVCGKPTEKTDSGKLKRFPRTLSKEETASADSIHIIESKCAEFDSPGKVTAVKVGPVVTDFKFTPSKFVRVKRVRGMFEDLAMALGTETVTINRVPGEGAVSIQVPNRVRTKIELENCIKNLMAVRKDYELPLNCGVDSMGNPLIIDLQKQPHFLIAGTTGSGKSVFLNNLITNLLYVKSPKQMQLVLIDPKSVELLQYGGLPHVKTPPVSNVFDALRDLNRLVEEMKRRLAFLHYKGVKNLKELNAKLAPEDRLPYVVVVIDEIAEIVVQEKKAFTELMTSISSVSRAAGMHVIAATQRPSVDVVSGKIKINFPCRAAFRVPSQGDSRTILTTKGAEQLLTTGDGLLMAPDHHMGLLRFHVPMVEDTDVKKIIRISSAMGHKMTVPADGVDEHILREFDKKQASQSKADNLSAADFLEREPDEDEPVM